LFDTRTDVCTHAIQDNQLHEWIGASMFKDEGLSRKKQSCITLAMFWARITPWAFAVSEQVWNYS